MAARFFPPFEPSSLAEALLPYVLHVVGFLAGGNAHHADGVADYFGGRFWPLGPVAICMCLLHDLD